MKKNFFKKLSFVLALAMTVSVTAPAAGAFAAASPALNSTKKYLHLSGVTGPNEFDFNIKNKVSGAKYAWTSENENVATVDEATGLATATGVGTTKVSVAITKSNGKKVTLSATVVVRDNIKTVAVANAPEKAIAVATDYDFNRTFTTESGSAAKTSSVTRWFVDKADKATITDAGLFNAKEAGTFKVTAVAFQSAEKYEAWKALNDTTSTLNVLATATVDVKVAATMTAAQKDLDTIEVKFDTPMTDVAKNLTVYSVVGTTEVKVTTVKAVTESTDKKSATVDFYVPLTEGATYVVKYTDVESVKFTAATAKAENVVTVKVNTTEAVVNTPTDISVSLLDAAGVDISTAALLTRVDFTSSNNKTFLSGKSLVIFTKGEATDVTATFHSQKWDTTGKEIGNISNTGTVVGVDAVSTVVGAVKAWTLVAPAAVPNFSDVKQKLAVGDSKKLFVQLNTTTGTTTSTVDSYNNSSKFKFETSDNTVLFINADNSLVPIKAGVVTVVVKYDDKAVDAITITVNAARTATTMDLSTTNIALSNSGAVNDKVSVTVSVKDQLGDDVTVTDLTFEKLAGSPSDATSDIAALNGTTKVDFAGAVAGASKTAGSYTYKITANKLSRYVTVTVTAPTSVTPVAYGLVLSTQDADSKSTTDDATPSVSIDLFGYAGVKTSKPAITGGAFKVEITNPDNVTTALTGSAFDLTSLSGNAITKVKNGTYKVTAYEQKTISGNLVWQPLDVKFFTVKDTQLAPVLAEVKAATYNASLSLDAIAQASFKVTYDGNDVTSSIVMGDYLGTVGGQIYVKNVKWTQTITDATGTYTLVHTVAIERNLKVQ